MSIAPRERRYLGMQPGDLDHKPYARFWNPRMAPLPDDVREALAHGPLAEPLLPPLDRAAREIETQTSQVENGFGLVRGRAMHLAIRTELPKVSPDMIDWWFGWHSDEPQRYKLWHPRAHVHAAWCSRHPPKAIALRGRERYVGRTSCVDEYIGSTVGSYAIRFVAPAELGFDERLLANPSQATAICARVGFANMPFDFGYLAHYVSRTSSGSEMRSRFWVGGGYAAARRGGPLGSIMLWGVQHVLKPGAADATALLVHCSQEMSHLATFLPQLHGELHEQ
ncbi:MAG: hypothetical protein AB7O59_14575 [Pirellulales bacterium]